VFLTGTDGGQKSDGEISHIYAGDVLLLEDTTGMGCTRSWNEGERTLLAAAVQLFD
jgi:hypothetical protein